MECPPTTLNEVTSKMLRTFAPNRPLPRGMARGYGGNGLNWNFVQEMSKPSMFQGDEPSEKRRLVGVAVLLPDCEAMVRPCFTCDQVVDLLKHLGGRSGFQLCKEWSEIRIGRVIITSTGVQNPNIIVK